MRAGRSRERMADVDRARARDDEQPRVRPPVQRRSIETWNRVLDAGVQVLEEHGYDGFTISAVCRRAGVAPPVIYARVETKDDLFVAVYEHGIARLAPGESLLADDAYFAGMSPARVVAESVRAVTGGFETYGPFLRVVILVSGAHAEIRRRGMRSVRELRSLFAERVLTATGADVTRSVVEGAFNTVFAVAVFRTAYGADFLGDDLEDLVDLVVNRLAAPGG